MNLQNAKHLLSMTERDYLKVSAVDEVVSFDENSVCLSLSDSFLEVCGSGLSVSSLSLEQGEITVRGRIDSLRYRDDLKRKKGIGRFFGA